jgi:hypothetical protein
MLFHLFLLGTVTVYNNNVWEMIRLPYHHKELLYTGEFLECPRRCVVEMSVGIMRSVWWGAGGRGGGLKGEAKAAAGGAGDILCLDQRILR